MTPSVLLCPHTHAGKPFKAGNRIVVDVATADWLIANGIARYAITYRTLDTDLSTNG